MNLNPWDKFINWTLIFEQDYYNLSLPSSLELQDRSFSSQVKWCGGYDNFNILLFEKQAMASCHPNDTFLFSSLPFTCLITLFFTTKPSLFTLLGRSYYLFNLKSPLALFPKARMPFIYFSIFQDILKIWLPCTPSSHDPRSDYVFPMKILATRCFKSVFSLTVADLVSSLGTQVCPATIF